MKKFIKPNFEFIFSISIIAILGLPLLVLAQTQKSIEIKITNGDTTVNGKDIKKLSAQDRKYALAELDNTPQTPVLKNNGSNSNIVIKRKSNTDGNISSVVIEKSFTNDTNGPVIADIASKDTSLKNVKVRLKKIKGADSVAAFTYRFDNDLPPMEMKTFSFDMANNKVIELNSRNSQVFNYSNTDNDGINTHISFRITDASKEKLKAITGTEKAGLELSDLSLAPEFSTGKTIVSFNLPSKTSADIKLTDTQGKVLLTDKTVNGTFSKKIFFPVNGVYYLHVKQGNNNTLKKIIKE